MNAIWQATINTPWWVYLLLYFLVKMGIQASKTRVVSLKRLLIIPLLFIAMSIHTLVISFKITSFSVTTWLIAILIGALLGWLFIYRFRLTVDKPHNLIEIPGTWSTLIIILIIFASKYYFDYQLGVDPALVNQSNFEFSLLAVSGLCSGFFLGRLFCYFYRFFTNPSVNLKKES